MDPLAMLHMKSNIVRMEAFQLHAYFYNLARICHFWTNSNIIGVILYIYNFETWYYCTALNDNIFGGFLGKCCYNLEKDLYTYHIANLKIF